MKREAGLVAGVTGVYDNPVGCGDGVTECYLKCADPEEPECFDSLQPIHIDDDGDVSCSISLPVFPQLLCFAMRWRLLMPSVKSLKNDAVCSRLLGRH